MPNYVRKIIRLFDYVKWESQVFKPILFFEADLMGSVLDRRHFEDTEKTNALGEESADPSESGSTPLGDRSETW